MSSSSGLLTPASRITTSRFEPVVVEAEHLLLVDAIEHLREAVLRLQQAEQLRRLLVDQLIAPRVLGAAGALQQLDRLVAVEEQRADRLREAQAPQPLDAVRDPLDVPARQVARRVRVRDRPASEPRRR